ncbi:MAG: hypothetical protein JF599_13895 [Verrucomicrobia bacterium]|nr:hypothetical protein [Verrucomicrobiota bacterium]
MKTTPPAPSNSDATHGSELSAPVYFRGDGAAARYLGWNDKQGRKFRTWAKRMKIPCAVIGCARCYRKADLDAAWQKAARITPGS